MSNRVASMWTRTAMALRCHRGICL